MPPAARKLDATNHGFPLNPGPGSFDVTIGFMPAWRAVPAALAAGLQGIQTAGDTAVTIASNARVAASGTPGAPAALAAEAAAKAAATAAFAAAISAAQGASAGMTAMSGNGTPDMHLCNMPALPPPGCMHGPGVVLQASSTVQVNGLPACRQGDKVVEALGGPDPIAVGCTSVLIG